MSLRNIISRNKQLKSFASILFSFPFTNRLVNKGHSNEISTMGAFMRNCDIRIYGNNNKIIVDTTDFTKLTDLKIEIHGDNNTLKIGRRVSTGHLSLCMEDNNNSIILGDCFRGGSHSHFAAIEGTSIIFGEDCMLSANITIRTGDSHSIIDAQTRKRINKSMSVCFGSHVWIGNTVLIFKGTNVSDHSIIAGGSVVTGKIFPSNVIIGGNPAKVIKENADWLQPRIEIE